MFKWFRNIFSFLIEKSKSDFFVLVLVFIIFIIYQTWPVSSLISALIVIYYLLSFLENNKFNFKNEFLQTLTNESFKNLKTFTFSVIIGLEIVALLQFIYSCADLFNDTFLNTQELAKSLESNFKIYYDKLHEILELKWLILSFSILILINIFFSIGTVIFEFIKFRILLRRVLFVLMTVSSFTFFSVETIKHKFEKKWQAEYLQEAKKNIPEIEKQQNNFIALNIIKQSYPQIRQYIKPFFEKNKEISKETVRQITDIINESIDIKVDNQSKNPNYDEVRIDPKQKENLNNITFGNGEELNSKDYFEIKEISKKNKSCLKNLEIFNKGLIEICITALTDFSQTELMKVIPYKVAKSLIINLATSVSKSILSKYPLKSKHIIFSSLWFNLNFKEPNLEAAINTKRGSKINKYHFYSDIHKTLCDEVAKIFTKLKGKSNLSYNQDLEDLEEKFIKSKRDMEEEELANDFENLIQRESSKDLIKGGVFSVKIIDVAEQILLRQEDRNSIFNNKEFLSDKPDLKNLIVESIKESKRIMDERNTGREFLKELMKKVVEANQQKGKVEVESIKGKEFRIK
ncbi:MAG: hypothetical protein A2275_18840 [Bacteroidetes bacterium RIFOXYA12_FULL_35_11]|nr:MAG: hypothetical protein A2X01_14470 [Bacteroidetes bacterium GWF2_35_48]OFY76840.1 MAG: hypothetical protein A2275_18840 [Bacteroidetes bacterium RIFOXYA12_FULL_35_11]OFY95821.1 MAG: hypothetical protein A2309_14615 [Bacteroidetes bacterium RIFOXYB2_FULL_35_7]